MLLVGAARAQAQSESSSSALAQGVKSISQSRFSPPSEKAASTASDGGGAGNPPGLAQAKNLLVHFQRLWA